MRIGIVLMLIQIRIGINMMSIHNTACNGALPYLLPVPYLLVSVIDTGTVTPNDLNRYRYVDKGTINYRS
jgi:hypothetical protein